VEHKPREIRRPSNDPRAKKTNAVSETPAETSVASEAKDEQNSDQLG